MLEEEALADSWMEELSTMRRRIDGVRRLLAAADPRLAFLAGQQGMFSLLPVTPSAVAKLRAEHGVYMAPNGRINLAGLRAADVETFVGALRAVGALPVPHMA